MTLNQRIGQLERVKAEYEHYAELASVEQTKAKAVLDAVDVTVGRGRRRERWIAFAINLAAGIIFFGLGIAVERYWLSGSK